MSEFTDLIDTMNGRLLTLAARVDELERLETGAVISNANVSNPPTDTELTAAFGARPGGFIGYVDDNGAGTTIWRVVRVASGWRYEQESNLAV